MSHGCNDNRFELIEKFKQKLVQSTNIQSSPSEMAVIDRVLFRFWQMGWLDKLDTERSHNSRNCLMCSNLYSFDDENGNQILICVEHDNSIVDPDQPACEDYNYFRQENYKK